METLTIIAHRIRSFRTASICVWRRSVQRNSIRQRRTASLAARPSISTLQTEFSPVSRRFRLWRRKRIPIKSFMLWGVCYTNPCVCWECIVPIANDVFPREFPTLSIPLFRESQWDFLHTTCWSAMWQLHIQKGAESVEMCRNGGRRQQRSSRFDEAHELATAGGLFVIDEHD